MAEKRIWVCEECLHIFIEKEKTTDEESQEWGHSCKAHPFHQGQRCEGYLKPYLPELKGKEK